MINCYKFLNLKKICLICSLYTTCLSFSNTDENKANRFILNTGYMEGTFNSNEGMSYFPLSVYETYNWGFRKLSVDNSRTSLVISSIIGNLLTMIPYGIVSIANHELGHATRYRYFGAKNVVYCASSSSDLSCKTVDSYFKMVLGRISTLGATGAFTYSNFYKSDSESLVIIAGGMNSEILIAKNLSEKILERGASVTDLGFYVYSKLGPHSYSSSEDIENRGDPIRIEKYYSKLGKNIVVNNLKNSYLLSFFLSGSLYSLIKGNLDYVNTANHHITPLNFYGFYLPDFYTYINKRGLSWETVLHYAYNKDLDIGLSYETVYLGDSYHQIAPQVRYAYNKNLNLKPQLMFGFGKDSSSVDMAGSLTAELENDRFGLSLKYTYYNASTLYGERNEPFKNKPNEILAGVFVYLN